MAVYSKILTVFLPLLLSCLTGITVPAQQNQQGQESRTGKAKSVHEFSPEDVLPDAQEDENPRQRKVQTGRPRQPNVKPVLSVARENPFPSPLPTEKSATRKISSSSPTAVYPPTVAQSNSISISHETERNRPYQKKLFVSVSLFFLVLGSLMYFISKYIKERRVDYQATLNSATQKERASESQQISSESETATELRVRGSSKVARGMKNKVRKAHNT